MAIALKFMLGGDDLVWLAPFMARAKGIRGKTVISVKYTMSVLFLTLVACALAVLIHAAAARSKADDELVDEIIATIAATLLIAYSLYMAEQDGYFEALKARMILLVRGKEPEESLLPSDSGTGYGTMADDDNDDEDLGPVKLAVMRSLLKMNACVDAACSCCAKSGDEQKIDAEDAPPPTAAPLVDDDDANVDEDEEDEGKKKADNSVIIVAFLGSMDDFMVYFTLALSSQLTWYELAIGITIGSIFIALIVGSLLESSERVAGCVERIPVPLILTGLAVFILVSAWTQFDGL